VSVDPVKGALTINIGDMVQVRIMMMIREEHLDSSSPCD